MKWYFAGRTKHRAKLKAIIKLLKKEGNKVEFDWTAVKDPRPFDQHLQKCQVISQKITQAILNSDIFVLISDPEGTDMLVELGIALAQASRSRRPKIYIVGKYNKRSLMHCHSLVIHKNSLQEILNSECKKIIKIRRKYGRAN